MATSSEAIVAQRGPFAVEPRAGRTHAWCACGRSSSQPFCDGSHKETGILPVVFKAERDDTAYLCGCKTSQRRPFLRRQPPPAVNRPRSVDRDRMRRQARRAAVLGGALSLAACSSSNPEPPPEACPSALFLDGAEQIAVYSAGAGMEPNPDQLRYQAVLSGLSSACRYVDEGVEMDLTFTLTAGRGPAFSSTPEQVTYFIATLGPDRRILKRDAYSAELDFEEGYAGARWSEQLTLLIRSITPGQGSYYTLFIGFQLDDEELKRREQSLLR